jgi:transcription-repair coupling factor (superfamily II helicase)
MQNSDTITREAIMRELRRGGQVYYLHNDVSTINQRAQQLSALVPEAKIGIGHGQLNEKELQKVMRDFYHQRFNLLLCTTIVENGLDVPTANTIIIDRADMLGLAQLHQIRGRVGRSHHQAYAYLFTPPKELISKDAKLRLDAISSLEELGAGFVLATHDMEIRGAGELLGEE